MKEKVHGKVNRKSVYKNTGVFSLPALQTATKGYADSRIKKLSLCSNDAYLSLSSMQKKYFQVLSIKMVRSSQGFFLYA